MGEDKKSTSARGRQPPSVWLACVTLHALTHIHPKIKPTLHICTRVSLFPRTTRERFLAKMEDRALKTPGFMEQCQVAQATYLQQMAEAKAAVGRLVQGGFTWAHRPDVPALTRLMGAHLEDWIPKVGAGRGGGVRLWHRRASRAY